MQIAHPTADTLRAAEPRDVPAIVGLIGELAEFEHLTHLLQVTPETLAPHLFGAEAGGRGAGRRGRTARWSAFALFFTNFSTFLAQPGLYLEDLFVEPEQRGRGIGQALLEHLAALAVERGYGRFEWSVLDWNEHAIRFYERHGRDGDARLAHLPRSPATALQRFGVERRDDADAPSVDRYDALHARLPLAGAGALQHRRGLLHALGARRRPTRSRSAASTKTARGATLHLRRAAARGQPRCANALRALGVQRGDRVAIVMPQRFETAVAHMAVLPARRGGDAAVDAVRPRRAGVPAAATARRAVAIVDESAHRQPARGARRMPGAATRRRGRRGARGRATSTGAPRWRAQAPRFARRRHARRRRRPC